MEPNLSAIDSTLHSHGFALIKSIGFGSYATAFTVKSLKYDTIFVAKVIHPNSKTENCNNNQNNDNKDKHINEKNDKTQKEIEKKKNSLHETYMAELANLQALDHPFVIRLYDTFSDLPQEMLYIILEYCERGSLMKMIQDNGPIPFQELAPYISQILKGVCYIHSRSIAHRDIKPDNIFLTYKNTVKIADFGFSQHCEIGKKIDDCRGSIAYCAPEILMQNEYDPFKADIWALGVTFYVMAVGKLPFNASNNATLRHTIEMGIFIFPKKFNEYLADLIKKMIVVDPSRRLDAEQLLNHDFFLLYQPSASQQQQAQQQSLLNLQLSQSNLGIVDGGGSRGTLSTLSGFNLADTAMLGRSSKMLLGNSVATQGSKVAYTKGSSNTRSMMARKGGRRSANIIINSNLTFIES